MLSNHSFLICCTYIEGEFAEVLEALDLATLGHPVVAHGVVVGCKLKLISFTKNFPACSSGFNSAHLSVSLSVCVQNGTVSKFSWCPLQTTLRVTHHSAFLDLHDDPAADEDAAVGHGHRAHPRHGVRHGRQGCMTW